MNNNYDLTDTYEPAGYVKEPKKGTPVTLYIKGNINSTPLEGYEYYGSCGSYTVFTDTIGAENIINELSDDLTSYRIIQDRSNSAIPMPDIIPVSAHIEPGAIIREGAIIKDSAVIMMGAVINSGTVVGRETMIHTNAVLGAGATTGERCRIGSGAVIAGVSEPQNTPVMIGDDVLVGANAVIPEGVRVGKGAVVAAGAVVTTDVPPYTVVAGIPAVAVNNIDQQTASKTEIPADLRK